MEGKEELDEERDGKWVGGVYTKLSRQFKKIFGGLILLTFSQLR